MLCNKLRSAALALALSIASMAGITASLPATAHASAAPLVYRAGYSVQGSWLCYGWSNGTYHCTQHWYRNGSQLVSTNPGWVPNVSAAPVQQPQSIPLVFSVVPVNSDISPTPANLSQWAYTGRAAYALNISGPYAWGNCTQYAWYRAQYLGSGLGNAESWAYNAARRGFTVSSTPRVGATVVFQPGVQGAGGLGHVAHVEAVYANGWFLISEMYFFWNGGGYGRVDYRYAHTGWGVQFIDG